MTEFASHHDESRRQISKSSSSSSTSKRVADTWSEARMFTQKSEVRGKSLTSINKEYNMKNVSILEDGLSNRGMDEKLNSYFMEDYKIARKSAIRPSDSSYTRKSAWDAAISAEKSSIVQSSKSQSVKDLKQDYHHSNKQANKVLADFHRKLSDPFCSDKKITVENVQPPSYFSHSSKIRQQNDISPDSHSNSFSHYRTVDHVQNGYSHSEINPSISRGSSHLQSHGSDSHKRYADLDKKLFVTKYESPVQAQNPALNYFSSINSKEEYSTPSSQKVVVPEESLSRPNSSGWGEEEYSNEEKSLAVNFSNPETLNPVPPTPDKTKFPYFIEMTTGMFKAIRQGPDHETLKIHIIENYGSGDLRDGGFSWGWSIEQRSSTLPSSKASSAKDNSANKDIHKSKRRLEFEKASGSPTPKKSKVRGSDGRDTKSNREHSSKAFVEDKEIKSKSNSVVPPKHSSPHVKSNAVHGEKYAKSSKFPHDSKRSPSNGKSHQSSEKHGGSAVSPVQKTKSPIYVPVSEMIAHHPKTDCSGKNKVIDDTTMGFISSKKERSAVYSGRKSALEVLPLKVMCSESVKKNILNLKIGKNVPFELLLPALKLCSPSKLHKVEEHNRHILRHTDCLWKKFCESEFRDQKRLNGEAWKDVYWRARNLREAKLKNLAASISNGMSKAHPERQAKWVGVGTNNPEKRQKKSKVEEVHKVETLRIEEIPRQEANGRVSSSSHKQPSAKKRSGSESSSSNSPHSAQKPTNMIKNQVSKTAKKTLAPLMSKTKKMLNFVNRRR